MRKTLSIFTIFIVNLLYADINDPSFIEYIKANVVGWEKSCNDYNLTSCNDVGILHANGLGVEQNYSKAKVFFEKSCNGANNKGCWYLGILYENAFGVKQDYSRAIEFYRKSCDSDFNEACNALGKYYREGLSVKQNYNEAKYLFEKACGMDHAEGCFNLGEIYLYGIGGISRDFNKAYTTHEKAYIHGFKGSAVALGKMNVLGQGRKQDCKKGIELYELAKEIPVSSYLLGVIYYSPVCGDVNLTKAEKYFKYAAKNNHSEAQYYYAKLLDQKNSEKYRDDVENWLNLSAKNGYSKAQVTLGHAYLVGDNVEQDYKKAKYWIQKAKEQNNSVAVEIWKKYKLWNY